MSVLDVLTKHANAFRQKTGVTSKLSISEMTGLMSSLKWGQSNLLKGTSNQYREMTGTNYLGITTASTPMHDLDEAMGTYYTYAATVTNKSSKNIRLEYWAFQSDGQPLPTHAWSKEFAPGTTDASLSVTFKKVSDKARLYIVTSQPAEDTETILVKDERLYIGTLPGVWTPNSSEKLGGVTKPTLIGFVAPRLEVAA